MTDTNREAAPSPRAKPRAAAQFLPLRFAAAVATAGIGAIITEGRAEPADVYALLERHRAGDWGDVCADDARLNDASAMDGSRTLGSYTLGGEKVWIIADAADENGKRLATVLLPEEY